MEVTPMRIPGAWVFQPRVHADERGTFTEILTVDSLLKVRPQGFDVAQVNLSTSAAGVVRGVHYADVPPGQAKYVQCASGSILDIVVDLRLDSPTFGQWDSVELSAAARTAVLISEGLGHAFCALTEATVIYACSTRYDPAGEHEVSPLDPALALPWPDGLELVLSAKDSAAPTLAEARAAGRLPR